jgi:hypothetical protein
VKWGYVPQGYEGRNYGRITMTRACRSGTAAKIIGVTLLVLGVMLWVVQRLISNSGMDLTRSPGLFLNFWSLYLPFLLIPGGTFLFWRGCQYAAKADAERIVTDSKPDVLYLRAFRSDPSTARYVFGSWLRTGWGLATEEEQLREVLRPIGDLIAIGQPGEGLPKPGAARIYASDEEWKEVVKGQMQAARLVVIRAGGGENLLWELEHAVETLDPQKVLILVLGMKAKHYESFRMKVNPVLGVSLPEVAALGDFKGVSGFIGFGADWKPSVFPLPDLGYSNSFFKPYRQTFKLALRPVFESFGLEWHPPPDVFWVNVIIWWFVILLSNYALIRSQIKSGAQYPWQPIITIICVVLSSAYGLFFIIHGIYRKRKPRGDS